MAQGLKRDKALGICGLSKNQFYYQPSGASQGEGRAGGGAMKDVAEKESTPVRFQWLTIRKFRHHLYLRHQEPQRIFAFL
jgi:hypothetical protein